MKNTLLIIALLWALGASGQGIYIDSYRFGGAPSAGLLLDDYPNAAAAYSLRKLRTAYTGNCIEVRRSNDNAISNIGFSGNYLDTTALKTFCGTNNCFVRTWYDQSGNAQHAQLAGTAEQPQIVASGVVVRNAGEVALNFAGRVRLDVPNASYLYGQFHFYGITVTTPTGAEGPVPTIFAAYTFANYKSCLQWSENTFQAFMTGGRRTSSDIFTRATSTTTTINNQRLVIGHLNYSAGVAQLFENGVNTSTNNSYHIGAMDSTSNGGAPDNIGGFSSVQGYEGFIHELIIYASNQSTNRTGIQSNINSFYNIY